MPENTAAALLTGTIVAASASESEGLIPLNPTKWPEFLVSSAIQSDPRIQPNNILQAVENLEATLEYMDSPHNITHWKDRLTKVAFDTSVVTAACEMPTALGTIFAGSYANQAAEQYVQEIIEDEVLKPMETQFSCELRLRGGPFKNNNNGNFTSYRSKPSLFGGVGIFGENAEKTGEKMLNRQLRRGNRPLWTYRFFGRNGTAFIMGNCDIVVQFPYPNGKRDLSIRFPTGKLFRRILSSKGYNSQMLRYIVNFLLIAGYIKYAIGIAVFLKKFIDKHGLKSIRVFKDTGIKIVIKYIKSVLKRIVKVKNKIRFNLKSNERKFNWKKWFFKKPLINES